MVDRFGLRRAPVVAFLIMMIMVPLQPRMAAAGGFESRTITGRAVRFSIPRQAAKSSFKPMADGRYRFLTATNVDGLGDLSVIVGPRGDPEATLENEISGAEASARTKHFRKKRMKAIEINRGRGVEGLVPGGKGGSTAYCITWTKSRQFELTLETKRGSVDPLDHPAWKALITSFRSDEAPLKKK